MDDFSDAEAAAEGSHLALYCYTDMKGNTGENKTSDPTLSVARYYTHAPNITTVRFTV